MRTIVTRLLLSFSIILPALFAQSDRIAGSIDARSRVVLKGNSDPQARLEFDRGAVDPSRRLAGITLNFKPTAAQQAALQELLKQQQDAASANYHHWLQPEEYANRFGLSASDLGKVAAWARSQGLGVEYQAHTRTWVRLSGSAGQVQSAFHVPLRRYEVNGEMHFAAAGDPSIPAALEPLISAIRGLDDFYPKPPHRILRQTPDFDVTSTTHALAPADLWTIYDMNPLLNANYTGNNQSLVVVGQSNTSLDDVKTFRGATGLNANNLPQIVFAGGTDPGTISGQSGEIDLDLEWAGGMAPNATIYYVYAEDSFLATQYAIDNNIAPVISSSYTTCEAQVSTGLVGAGAYFEGLAQQGNALGITWVVASGDLGAAACETSGASTAVNGLAVNMPASIPEVTGVGGTTFNDSAGGYWSATNNPANSGSALKYIPEGAWNDTSAVGHLSASGGGASALYQKPSWQTGLGVPNDGARDVPDIAFSASEQHVPYVVVEGGQLEYIGGTSASAPVFAGMLTLLNQYLVANKLQAQPGLGNVNPTLYRLAHSSANAFHDITSGSNVVPCALNTTNCGNGFLGYNAGPGYDEVTGLGSIDLAILAGQWGAPIGGALSFSAAPAIMNQNAQGSTCPFGQYLTLQETNGFGVDLTSFVGAALISHRAF
jgi:subtilase family serine protease